MKAKFSLLILSLFLVVATITTVAQEQKETLRFMHLSDLHLIFHPKAYNTDFVQSRFQYFWDTTEPVKNFFKSVPSEIKPEFIAITGDMIDYYDTYTSDGIMLGTQIEQFQTFIDSVTNEKLYMTLGNHDITSYPMGGYHQNTAAEARATWIRNVPCFSKGTYYSRLYDVGLTTYRLIFLDNSYFSKRDNNEQADFIIDKYQLDWLRSQLKESSTDKEIIFMHMSLPFDKSDGSEKESYDEYVTRTNTKELLDIITETENSSLQAFVVGHEHENNIHKFDFSKVQSFTQIMTGALGNTLDNWRLVELTESDIIVYKTGTDNKEITIPLN
ncbi:MAG TPA: metallophosphoesterase [Dysgonamonadaceae bacterium]|nr:metallophosphoesterase [Dysgonamonadaceae bacterium]